MSKIFYLFFFIPLFLFSQEMEKLENLPINEIKKKLLKKQQSYKTYKAYFKKLSKNTFQLGQIFIKKPDKLKILFFKKYIKNINSLKGKEKEDFISAEVYIYKGEMYSYFLEDKVVFKNKFDKNSFQNSFLKNWVADYEVSFQNYDRKKMIFSNREKTIYKIKKNIPHYHLQLRPTDITSGLNKMDLWINEDSQIIRSKVFHREKIINDLYFFNITYNKEISNKEMTFTLPKNIQMVDNFLN